MIQEIFSRKIWAFTFKKILKCAIVQINQTQTTKWNQAGTTFQSFPFLFNLAFDAFVAGHTQSFLLRKIVYSCLTNATTSRVPSFSLSKVLTPTRLVCYCTHQSLYPPNWKVFIVYFFSFFQRRRESHARRGKSVERCGKYGKWRSERREINPFLIPLEDRIFLAAPIKGVKFSFSLAFTKKCFSVCHGFIKGGKNDVGSGDRQGRRKKYCFFCRGQVNNC